MTEILWLQMFTVKQYKIDGAKKRVKKSLTDIKHLK